jgi:hypothetical protein
MASLQTERKNLSGNIVHEYELLEPGFNLYEISLDNTSR